MRYLWVFQRELGMLVVLSHYPGDEELCLKLAGWIRELGPYPGHQLLLIADVRSSRSLAIRAEFDGAGFDKIEELSNPSIIDGWPHAANFVFSMAARHIAATNNQPFLWLEPDVVPMRGGWLDTLQTAYTMGGQPFFGDYVNVDNVPPHCSGIAIYPGDLIEAGAGNALIAGDIAWDCAVATQVLPKLHKTKLIGHAWRHPPFANTGELDNLRGQHPDMVLFHADKSGSLIDLLRMERKKEVILDADSKSRSAQASGETNPTTTTSWAVTSGGGEDLQHTPRPSFTCDIFIKTYPPDYPWLAYCLRSINKFATGFRKSVIVHPEGQPPTGADIGYTYHGVGEQPDGYLWQMVIKLDADRYTDAAFILYIDSDTIFTKPVSPKNYMANGKVIWMLTPYEKVSTPWQPTIEKFLKKPVRFEFMRRQPFLVPRWLLAELRAFCEREHGITLDAYILGQPHRAFSEFNALGAFAYEFFRDEFVWVNTEETPPDQWPVLTVMQSWSRGGLTDEIKGRYEEILGGEDAVLTANDRITGQAPAKAEKASTVQLDSEQEEVKQEGGESPDNAVSEMQLQRDAPPSTDLDVSIPLLQMEPVRADFTVPIRLNSQAAKWDRVEQLVLELKGYCDNPSSTSRVRKAIVGAGLFPQVILGWLKQKPAKKKRRVS